MSNIETAQEVNDWREGWFKEHSGYNVTIIFEPVDPELLDDDINPDLGDLDAIFRKEEQQIVDSQLADAIYIEYIDPSVGASGYGIGIVLEFLDVGADIIAFAALSVPIAGKIKQAYKRLRKKFKSNSDIDFVHFSEEAIRILTLSDLLLREKIDPNTILSVDTLVHDYPPMENAKEKQIIYSAYTVTIKTRADEYVTVWNYLVASDGRIASRSKIDIPIPNMTHWTDSELPNEVLKSLSD